MDSIERYNQEKAIKLYYQMQYAPFTLKNAPKALTEPFYQTINSYLKLYLNPNSNILEIGCGLGRVIFEAQKIGINTGIGIDISDAFIKESRKIQQNKSKVINYRVNDADKKLSFEVGDAHKLKYLDNQFNVIICLNVIDRLSDPQKAVEEIKRLLEKSGILIICDPYDWIDQTLPENRVESMHELFSTKDWEVLEEIDNLPFEIFSKPRKHIHYDNHLLVLRKR